MQRNDLITELSQHENDPVAVNINGRICDVRGVATGDGCLLLVLDHGGEPGGDSTPAPADEPSTA
jgi:hypothetical protein